jgi:hypothetical protein
MYIAPDMTPAQIDQHLLNCARRNLDSLISKRDWYIADTHDRNVLVALWRTFTRNKSIINLNNMIEDQRDYVEHLEDELAQVAPVPFTLSHDAQAVLADRVLDLVDWLSQAHVTVSGTLNRRTLRTDDGSIIVERNGVDEYSAPCGDGSVSYDDIVERLDGFDAHLIINGMTFTSTDPHATQEYIKPVALISDSARAVLDLFVDGDVDVKGELDGLTVTSTHINGRSCAYRVTATLDGVTVYEVDSTGNHELNREALCEAAHGLNVNLEADGADLPFTLRLKGDGAVTYVSENNWEVTRLPARVTYF